MTHVNAIRSHVASCTKYLEATCIKQKGTSYWVTLHIVVAAISPSHNSLVAMMSVDAHLGACRESPHPLREGGGVDTR